MNRRGQGGGTEDEIDTDELDEETVAVLRAIGIAGTEESARYRLNYDDQMQRFLDRYSLEPPDDLHNLRSHLAELEDKGFDKYIGHGVWRRLDKGHELIHENTVDNEENSGQIRSTSVIHPKSSIVNAAAYIVILGLSLLQAYSALQSSVLQCQNLGSFLVLAILVPVLIIIALIHVVQSGVSLTKIAVSRFISINNPFATFDEPEKERAYNSQINDMACRSVANSFRYWGFAVVPLTLLLGASLSLQTNIPGQSYGLVLDAAGGIYLALEVLRSDRLGRAGVDMGSSSGEDETKTVTDGLWGASFLIVGFLLQFVSLLPWTTFLAAFSTVCT